MTDVLEHVGEDQEALDRVYLEAKTGGLYFNHGPSFPYTLEPARRFTSS